MARAGGKRGFRKRVLSAPTQDDDVCRACRSIRDATTLPSPRSWRLMEPVPARSRTRWPSSTTRQRIAVRNNVLALGAGGCTRMVMYVDPRSGPMHRHALQTRTVATAEQSSAIVRWRHDHCVVVASCASVAVTQDAAARGTGAPRVLRHCSHGSDRGNPDRKCVVSRRHLFMFGDRVGIPRKRWPRWLSAWPV